MHHHSWPQYRQAKRTLNFWCGYGRQNEYRAGSMSNNYSKYLKARWFTTSQSLILKQNENPRLMVKVNSKVMSFIVNVFYCSWRNNNYFLDRAKNCLNQNQGQNWTTEFSQGQKIGQIMALRRKLMDHHTLLKNLWIAILCLLQLRNKLLNLALNSQSKMYQIQISVWYTGLNKDKEL